MNTTTRIQIALLVALILSVITNTVHHTRVGHAAELTVSVALILNGVFGLHRIYRRPGA